ncbi:Bardet-Biedl syndrome 12 protein [Elgaria multicarinata webbii]|uniref:Bardet-Biedl syndrome 12 protein n=1 Tax=Elgaria multicarinata webbii TaxID=159646 RepID=UPI002FCD4EB4
MAFRNMNRKRHIGLQQLSALAATGRTLLGPVKSSKFIVDESAPGGVLICSAVRLLESLDLSSAAGQLLNEAVQAQDKEYKTGANTLLFLVSTWSNAVLECLQQDVPLSVMVAVMSEALNACIEQMHCIALSLHNIQQRLDDDIPIEHGKIPVDIGLGTSGRQIIEIKTPGIKSNNSVLTPLDHPYEYGQESEGKSEGPTMYPGAFGTGSTADSEAKSVHTSCKTVIQKNCILQTSPLGVSNHNKKSKLTYSRYFSSERKSHSLQQTDQLDKCRKHPDGLKDLTQLAMSLSHGNWPAMKLVQDVLRWQLQTANKMADTHPFHFNISEVVTCCLPGMAESHACVRPGYITLVSPEKAAVAKCCQNRSLRIILADGDLTETYRHLGFNKSQNVRTFLESTSYPDNSSSSWVDCMLDILVQSGVNLVLVQGNVCKSLEERCLLNNIVIINQVAQSVLGAFSDITGASRVSYLSQVNERCIGKGICMNLYGTPELSWVELDGRMPVALTAKGIRLVTVVLSCPVIAKMQATEDCFWTCAYRVHHALLDQAVFPGGGAVEFLCLSYLESLGEASKHSSGEFHVASSWLAASSEQYKPLALQALARGWHQYLCTVLCNTADYTSEFEAGIFIQQHLRKAARCGSPSAYILDEFKKGKMGVASIEQVVTSDKALKVCDNVTAKMEAWRRALDVVLLVLQTDAEIITGPERDQLLKSQVSSEFLFL